MGDDIRAIREALDYFKVEPRSASRVLLGMGYSCLFLLILLYSLPRWDLLQKLDPLKAPLFLIIWLTVFGHGIHALGTWHDKQRSEKDAISAEKLRLEAEQSAKDQFSKEESDRLNSDRWMIIGLDSIGKAALWHFDEQPDALLSLPSNETGVRTLVRHNYIRQVKETFLNQHSFELTEDGRRWLNAQELRQALDDLRSDAGAETILNEIEEWKQRAW